MPTKLFIMRKLGREDRGGRTLFVGIGEKAEQAAGYTLLEGGDPEQGKNFEVVKAVPLDGEAKNYGSLGDVLDRMRTFMSLMGDGVAAWDDFVNDFAQLVCASTCDALGA
jgi:hypothetical protein